MAPLKQSIAIGLNILPSIPERERIGINTIKMINCPKIAEFIILEAPLYVIWYLPVFFRKRGLIGLLYWLFETQ
jgi:hypothetical protein